MQKTFASDESAYQVDKRHGVCFYEDAKSIQLTAADSRALTKLLEKKEKIEREIEKIMGGGVKRKTAKTAAANKPKTAKEKEATKNRRDAQQRRREREAKEKAKAVKA